ncbi:uncharacterized protein HMPREF1541_05560 [Cyphellophora europaea CBS 101466]|uniref:Transcription factor TFIIIC triple barrel domain-containing protein n=1 Tax=Cyphellophora europaea (strain CBS 101466) TaxID=1220924 RepID=W2RSA8_CYPE1|nr:uncharacterized protein HMPREF1541_05560 [Cyphellophora europaea CBS 101466]ETN39337.1 hypothetical protein HMPREF1541_05560 [Cyphellophora europaea CBS 101466]
MAEDEYEYQYDANETSTFLVELDLSTLNGINRGNLPKKTDNRRRKVAPGIDEDDGEDSDSNADSITGPAEDGPDAANHRDRHSKHGLQVLELHSMNPMVSFKGDFYSCAWHDLIGTNMFYSMPHQDIGHAPLRSTKDYNLLGTSRVKLVGQRAKVYEKASARKRQRVDQNPGARQDGNGSEEVLTTQSVVGASLTPADPASETREQADFLQKLRMIQQSRQTTSNGTSLADRGSSADAKPSASAWHTEE